MADRPGMDKKPVQEVKYLDANDYNITEALYSSLLDTGAVVGPIKLHNGDNIIMRINNWKDEILFSGEDQRIRWNKIAEKIRQEKKNVETFLDIIGFFCYSKN